MGRRARSDPFARVDVLPVRHHSAGCAHHVARFVAETRPVAVLIEGPEDANPLLPHLLDPETRPPVAVLSTYVDARGEVGPPDADGQPQRFRALFPLLAHAPEWAALRAGDAVGAAVRFVDVPHDVLLRLVGALPTGELHAREGAWLARIAARTGRTTFEGAFDALFEARAHTLPTDVFFAELRAFAALVRQEPSPSDLLREAHVRAAIDAAVREFPEGRICVVTGAYHAPALAGTAGKRAKAKADKGARVVLTTTSHAALVRLAGVPSPAWGAALAEGLAAGAPDPARAAAERLLVEVAARLRAGGWPVGTADAVAAVGLADGLGRLRGGGPAAEDVREAARHAFVRGDDAVHGPAIGAIVDAVLAGASRGALPAAAGRPPLLQDFLAEAKAHRVDVSGDEKVLRCDVLRQESHRLRSAFLHRCTFLGLPMFAALPDGQDPAWFKGPVPEALGGEGSHLLGETWGVRWSELVDDRLLELADRGVTLVEVATVELSRRRAAAVGADVRARVRLVVDAARMRLHELLDPLLGALSDALPAAPRFDDRVHVLRALLDLGAYQATLPTFGSERVAELADRAWVAACLALPELARSKPEEAPEVVEDLATVLRTAPGRDPDVLRAQLEALHAADAPPAIRGAAAGALSALGVLPERRVARELGALFRGASPDHGALYLEGILRMSRTVFLAGRGLLDAVHDALLRLDDERFVALLPDLRRAFSVFVPSELEDVGRRVAAVLDPPEPVDLGVDPARRAEAAALDAKVTALLARRLA